MKKRGLVGAVLGICIALGVASGVALSQPTREKTDPWTMKNSTWVNAPPLSGFIHIRVDELENYRPAVAYNSLHNEYLVVWEEHIHGGEVAIYGQRVDSGGRLKGPAFPVAHLTNLQLVLPDVAYSPKQDAYLVTWVNVASSSDHDIAATPVSWDGVVGSPIVIDIDLDNDWYPAVAYNSQNDEFLVVYEKYISSTRRDIEAQRVKASDWLLLSWRNIAGANNQVRRLPDVAYDAARNEYLIAYTHQSPPTAGGDIVGRRSDFNMSTLSSEIQITGSGYPPQDGVALAAGPNEYLAVWYEDHGASQDSVWGRRVGGDGTLNSFINIAHDSGKQRVEPAVAYGDGGHYLVTWRFIAGASPNWDIYGRHVRAGQNSPEAAEFSIDSSSVSQKVPALACAVSNPCLVAYEDNWPESANDYEIRGRLAGHWRVFLPQTARNQ